jgi:thiamine-monophosphate kinase
LDGIVLDAAVPQPMTVQDLPAEDLPLSRLGEKRILADIVLPLLNPGRSPDLAGDDCAFVSCRPGERFAVSTDRVPWDLTGRSAGVMDLYDLGRHLAALNLSDIAAVGARPVGLLLNIALPPLMTVRDLLQIFSGARAEASLHATPIIGGDLSSSEHPELSATALGLVGSGKEIRRRGAVAGDLLFVSRPELLGAAAFAYFRANFRQLSISSGDEERLRSALKHPHPDFAAANAIRQSGVRATAMDNTDGLAQSLWELAAASEVTARIDCDRLLLHPTVRRVAEALQVPAISLALGPGYDFGLVGTVSRAVDGLSIIGTVDEGPANVLVENAGLPLLPPHGWDYWT